MIERGHLRVWSYGFSFFLTAIGEGARLEKERIKHMAIAYRVAKQKDSDFKSWVKKLE